MADLLDENAGSIVPAGTLGGNSVSRAIGEWTVAHAKTIERVVKSIEAPASTNIAISLKDIKELDTSGAWLLLKLRTQWMQKGGSVDFVDMTQEHQHLLTAIADAADKVKLHTEPRKRISGFIIMTRQWLRDGCADALRLVSLLGALAAAFGRRLVTPGAFRFPALVTHMMRTGLTAVPIVALMSFVIGAIIAQQGAYQLSFYGAEPMAVDMVSVLVTRDMGVLLTAIMVSGRSGSAYTAEIGSMKMREEIDALKVIGLDPVDVLLFPRILALILVLPFLTVIADYASLLGAQIALWVYIDMSWEIFLHRMRDAVPLPYFMMGIIKAPFMALIIGLIAMSEGLKVEGSSESLSRHTTISVVKSIFMVIVVDGIFAVISASLGY
ncbi:MAG: ABC transporter permease [Hyphomicrobiales bacterium]